MTTDPPAGADGPWRAADGPWRATDGAHGIVCFADRLHQVLDGLAGTPGWSMTADEQRHTLTSLARAEARVTELRLRVLTAADKNDIGKDNAAPSTAAWVAANTRQVRAAAHADVRLADVLDQTYDATRAALAQGRVNADQARVIVNAIDALPDTVMRVDRARGEAHLIAEAAHHDAKALKILGRRIFEVLDPDAADEHEAKKLEDDERKARRTTFLTLHDNGDGSFSGRFKIPALHAQMLKKMLHALTSPRSIGKQGRTHPDGTRIPTPELMGAGFCELLERYPATRLPKTGGISATLVITMTVEKLLNGIGVASLDTGGHISAAQARRLACEAGIIPVVLNGASEILDQGRKKRLHTEAQRVGMGIRDKGCTEEHCTMPPGLCHAHHDQETWANGGETSVAKGRLLCPFHHGKAHDPRYEMGRLPNGKVRFNRRT